MKLFERFSAVLVLVTLCCHSCDGSDVVELTDENFDALISQGTWMVKVFAPWCSHCRKVRPIWEELATTLKEEGIQIGAIDGSKERVLVHRFETTGFPSFYHLKDGQCREYNGQRTVQSFAQFARSGYRNAEPMAFYRAPNGPVSQIWAAAKKLPMHILELYKWLHFDKEFSQLTIVALTLSIPVSIGLGLICLLDCLHSRTQNRGVAVARPHAE